MQVMCDLVSSKDGKICGEKRIHGKDSQFVKVFMTSPDLVWQGSYPEPRFGPKAMQIAIAEVFKQTYGYEIEII